LGLYNEVKTQGEDVEEKYSSYVKRAPTLIQTNGLGNTLALYRSKIGKDKDEKMSADKKHTNFFMHIQTIGLKRNFIQIKKTF